MAAPLLADRPRRLGPSPGGAPAGVYGSLANWHLPLHLLVTNGGFRPAGTFERWRPDDVRPEVLHDRLLWQPAGAAEPLVVDVQAYFREAWGE